MKLFLSLLILQSSSLPLHAKKLDKEKFAWTITKGIETPESVYFDAPSKALYISNIAGEGTLKDGRGWICKVGLDGKMIQEKWVDGLNAPKGMRSLGDTLWVSDIDTVHEIDIRTAKVLKSTTIKGAKFLNDIAVSPEPRVFVSDTLDSKIYEIKVDGYHLFATGPELESPNGLLVIGDELIVASWGSTKDFNTKTPGRLYSIHLKTKKITSLQTKPFGNLDGLEISSPGHFFISDWVAGKVFQYDSKKNKASLILEGFKGAADIAYLSKEQLLVVPRMNENEVTAYSMK